MKKVNVRTVLISSVAAIIAGIIAVLLIWLFAGGKSKPKEEYVSVIVTKRDISANTVVSNEDIEIKKLPSKLIPANAVKNLSQTVGMRVSRDVKKGEILTTDVLYTVSSIVVPEGYVALGLKIDNISGVGGLIKPGDLVNVIGFQRIQRAGGMGQDMVSATVLQNIKVLFVDGVSQKESKISTVVLQLTPEDAQKLVFLYNSGNYALALKNPNDTFIYPIKSTTIKNIVDIGRVPVSTKKIIGMEVIEIK